MSDNTTINTYDKYAHAYDNGVVEFWRNFPREFLDQFATSLPGKRILNVGSGPGRDALLLKDRGLEVVCVDGSKSMVDITSKLGFTSYLADFGQLAFPQASFDGIWAYTSLVHVPKDEARQVIQKLRTFLKPDGIFAIGVIEGETASMITHEILSGAERYFKKYTKQELQELIEALGFSLLYDHDYLCDDATYINQLYKITAV